MNDKEIDDQELAKWDPEFVKQLANVVAPAVKRWFRAEVRGLENVPPVGGALMVSNHSGGVLTPDVPVLGPAFWRRPAKGHFHQLVP
jgi:1-acyl-sn-glycerol-3-phosphate acyltransferase